MNPYKTTYITCPKCLKTINITGKTKAKCKNCGHIWIYQPVFKSPIDEYDRDHISGPVSISMYGNNNRRRNSDL